MFDAENFAHLIKEFVFGIENDGGTRLTCLERGEKRRPSAAAVLNCSCSGSALVDERCCFARYLKRESQDLLINTTLMGGFYTNYTLKGPSQKAVASVLAGHRAIVSPESNGCVVAYDEASDDQDGKAIAALASHLSGSLHCPVLAVLVHDDDILWYQLYEDGNVTDEYDSTPGYFDPSAEPSAPAGGDAERLCRAFGASDVAVVEAILRKSSFDADGYVFAHERHTDLVRALGLPEFAVLTAYASFDRSEYPDGLTAEDMMSSV